ncbi:MAG: hypothetical protein ACFCUM_12295 [Bacteroidales bacterium]
MKRRSFIKNAIGSGIAVGIFPTLPRKLILGRFHQPENFQGEWR